MKRYKVGIIGCGNICSFYLKNITERLHILEVVTCADLVVERAKEVADKFNVPKACTVDELLKDPEVEIVLNLTIPNVHAEVSVKALEAGKHVYVEKPLATTREDGQKVLETAKAKGLFVGCAPDTFMGAGLQTCRKIIDDGWIGEPVAVTGFVAQRGPESWHPNPEFFYKFGGGPMFDIGPYYLNAFISLLGPFRNVAGSARISFPERTATCAEKYGLKIKVEVPTHVAGIINFESGVVGTLITSFDIWDSKLPFIEVYGSEGTLSVPNPNGFGGPVLIRRQGESEWREVPHISSFNIESRGMGLADMAYSIYSGRQHRASGEMAYHVLDTMHGFYDASREGRNYCLNSTCKRPAAVPAGLDDSILYR
jgi:predicted dehydrogenase